MVKKVKKETFEKRLKIYSATAAGVLAIAPTAEAAIHYSEIQNLPVNLVSVTIFISFEGINKFNLDYDSVNSYIVGISNAANAQIHINKMKPPPQRCSAVAKQLLNKRSLANPDQWNNQEELDTLNGANRERLY